MAAVEAAESATVLVLFAELRAAMQARDEAWEAQAVADEAKRLADHAYSTASGRVNLAEKAIMLACATPRAPRSMGDIYKAHGLR